jgi:hypothetical protein
MRSRQTLPKLPHTLLWMQSWHLPALAGHFHQVNRECILFSIHRGPKDNDKELTSMLHVYTIPSIDCNTSAILIMLT